MADEYYVYVFAIPAIKHRGDDIDHFDSEGMPHDHAINFAQDIKTKFGDNVPILIGDNVLRPEHYRAINPRVKNIKEKRSR